MTAPTWMLVELTAAVAVDWVPAWIVAMITCMSLVSVAGSVAGKYTFVPPAIAIAVKVGEACGFPVTPAPKPTM